MRHTLAKLMALLAAVTLLLTGCNLIEVNQMAIIEEENEKLMKGMSAVMAEFDGGTVSKFEVLGPFYSNYSYMAQLYQSFGMEISEEDVQSILQDAASAQVMNYAVAQEVAKRGLTLSKTDDEIAQEAEEAFENSVDYYMGMLEETDAEVKRAKAEQMLMTEGMTLERLNQLVRAQYEMEALDNALRAEVADVTEDEVKEAYDAKLAADEENYTAAPANYENDVTAEGSVICWVPEGYRTVKHILVIPEEEVLSAVTTARSDLKAAERDLEGFTAELEKVQDDEPDEGETFRSVEEIQADIDAKNAEVTDLKAALTQAETACIASVQEKLDAVYAELNAGTAFDAVMETYGEDPGMKNEPNKTTGYYVCDGSQTWDPDFKTGAMALAKVGDYSAEPVISTSGVHIIYYNSDVTAGAVALDDIHDEMKASVLEEKQTKHSTETMTALAEALNPVYHMENWTADESK